MLDEEEHPKTYEQVRCDWVEGEIINWFSEKEFNKFRYSEYRRALEALTRAATEYAISKNASLDGYGSSSFDSILQEAALVISELRFAARADQGEDNEQMRLWSHRIQPLYDLKAKKTPDLSRPDIEAVVGRYLQLPYRSQEIDRLFVDVLVALELYAFGNETINAPSIPGIWSASPLKRRPIVEWLVNNLLGVVFWIIVAFALWGLSLIHLFPVTWLIGTNILLGLLFFTNLAWSTVALPGACWGTHKEKQRIVALLQQMNGVYAELRSDGPISARHIEERARKAADAGVVWPAPLFVLLDDISARGGRF